MLFQEKLYQSRAFESALWGMPAVNFLAMRRAYLEDIGAQYNDLIYFSQLANWKFQTTTPNNANFYSMFFANLKSGPVILEIPRSTHIELFGSVIDGWNIPIADVGIDGLDGAQGGKYLFLPPDYDGEIPDGYFAAKSPTYNIYSLFRATPKANDDKQREDARAFHAGIRIHPPGAPGRCGAQIDAADKLYEGIAPYDLRYFYMLDQMVKEEPVWDRDFAFRQILRHIGIGDGLTFAPTERQQELLEDAIREAHAFMMENECESDWTFYPDTQWKRLAGKTFATTGKTCILPDRLDYDARAAGFFAFFGAPVKVPPNLYLKSHKDASGEILHGSHTYRLRVPANCPTTQFWSLNTYDNATAGFLRGVDCVGLDTLNHDIRCGDDGSADFFFCPERPSAQNANWLPTLPGVDFFVVFRNYVPLAGVMEGKNAWTLPDIERI